MSASTASTTTTTTGACWPFARRALAGFRRGDCPRGCGADCDDNVHTIWECPATEAMDHPAVRDTAPLAKYAIRDRQSLTCYWGRGIVPRQWLELPPPADECIVHFVGNPSDLAAASIIFLDGSGGPDTRERRLRRCGAGIACLLVEAEGRLSLLAGAYTGLPGPVQTVPRAELYAGVAALRISREGAGRGPAGVLLVSDNDAFVRGANSVGGGSSGVVATCGASATSSWISCVAGSLWSRPLPTPLSGR